MSRRSEHPFENRRGRFSLESPALAFLKKVLDNAGSIRYNNQALKNSGNCAGVAHLVERHLAKVEVASSSLVFRSKWDGPFGSVFFCSRKE